MAKALIGYLPTSDPRQTRELTHLRRRVADLEAQVSRLSGENDALVAAYLALRPSDDTEPRLAQEHASV
jgi:cell division protein FtsB